MEIIIENEFTSDVMSLCVVNRMGSDVVFVGHKNGTISEWQYFGQGTLEHLRNHQTSDKESINILIPFKKDKFISVDDCSRIKVWDADSVNCEKVLEEPMIHPIVFAIILPDNLLVVSGYWSPAWECFNV